MSNDHSERHAGGTGTVNTMNVFRRKLTSAWLLFSPDHKLSQSGPKYFNSQNLYKSLHTCWLYRTRCWATFHFFKGLFLKYFCLVWPDFCRFEDKGIENKDMFGSLVFKSEHVFVHNVWQGFFRFPFWIRNLTQCYLSRKHTLVLSAWHFVSKSLTEERLFFFFLSADGHLTTGSASCGLRRHGHKHTALNCCCCGCCWCCNSGSRPQVSSVTHFQVLLLVKSSVYKKKLHTVFKCVWDWEMLSGISCGILVWLVLRALWNSSLELSFPMDVSWTKTK